MADIGDKKLNLQFNKENSDKKKGFSFAKIKGASSFAERLKSFSKKDIAWLVVGVVILIMAPVAEYFISKPKTNTALTPGFGERRMIDSGGIYEPGINALSAGSPDGMEEVIAPLTARDPASLILGAKKETPPPMPITPPQETKRDSIADIAKKSFSDATKSSPAPFIPPKMQSYLRGASSFFSGGEGSRTSGVLSSGKIIAEAKSAPSHTQKKTLLGPQAIPGFKGVALRSDSVNKGAFEKLRTQADKAADFFSGANAKEALENAAAASINPVGGGGFGTLQDGGRGSGFPNNSLRDSRSYSPGDPCRGSLERELYCQEQRKKKEFELWLRYELPKQLIQAAVDNIIVKGLFDPIGKKVAQQTNALLNPQVPSAPKYCWKTPTKKVAVIINKKDNGEIQLIPPVGVGDCPCGFLTSEPDPSDPSCRSSGGGSSGSGAGSGSASGSGSGGSSGQSGTNPGGDGSSDEISDLKGLFEQFDVHLKEAIQAARVGEEATNVSTLKTQATKTAENIEQAISAAQNITQQTTSKIDSQSFKKISEYGSEINKVSEQVKQLRNEYDTFYKEITEFESTLNKAIADYKSGKIKPKLEEGVVAETLGGQNVPVKLEEALQRVKKIKEDTTKVKEEYLVKFEQRVKSHSAAYSWYANQVNTAKNIAQSIYAQSGGQASEMKSISSQISAIPDNTSDQAAVNNLKSLFAQLTGKTPQNVGININPSSVKTASVSGDFRMSPGGDKISVLIKWRGADESKAWSLTIDDSAEVDKERNTFESSKPSAKFEKGEFPLSFNSLPTAENFIAPLIRGVNIEKDVERAKSGVGKVLEGVNGYNTLLGANKTDLNELKDEIKPLLDQLNPSPTQPTSPNQPSPPTPSQQIIINNQIMNNNSQNVQNNQSQQQQPKPKPTSSPKPTSQPKPTNSPKPTTAQASPKIMQYQSMFNTHVEAIKDAKLKANEAKAKSDSLYVELNNCLKKYSYMPSLCNKVKSQFEQASDIAISLFKQVSTRIKECEDFKNSIPPQYRKQIVGECR